MLLDFPLNLFGKERPVGDVPRVVVAILGLALLAQIVFQLLNPGLGPEAKPLPPAPQAEILQLTGLDDPVTTSRLTMLWLQAFDNQPGISIPFRKLDYSRVINWLDAILELDSRSQYPLLAASRVYSEVPDENKKRMMLEFVHEKFLDDPNRRWPALAHAVYVAKHRLRDLPLALRYARSMAEHVTAQDVPYWVQQMQIYVLEDMGEVESAKILIGGLIDSGAITDAHELRFLQQRLEKLEEQQNVK